MKTLRNTTIVIALLLFGGCETTSQMTMLSHENFPGFRAAIVHTFPGIRGGQATVQTCWVKDHYYMQEMKLPEGQKIVFDQVINKQLITRKEDFIRKPLMETVVKDGKEVEVPVVRQVEFIRCDMADGPTTLQTVLNQAIPTFIGTIGYMIASEQQGDDHIKALRRLADGSIEVARVSAAAARDISADQVEAMKDAPAGTIFIFDNDSSAGASSETDVDLDLTLSDLGYNDNDDNGGGSH